MACCEVFANQLATHLLSKLSPCGYGWSISAADSLQQLGSSFLPAPVDSQVMMMAAGCFSVLDLEFQAGIFWYPKGSLVIMAAEIRPY